MQSSRILELKIKQAEKYKREHEEFDLDNSILDSFCTVLDVARPMAEELYEHFHADREKLFAIIELFNNELTKEEATIFDKFELTVMVDLVNRFAGDMDLDRLQFLMQFFLDIDAISSKNDAKEDLDDDTYDEKDYD